MGQNGAIIHTSLILGEKPPLENHWKRERFLANEKNVSVMKYQLLLPLGLAVALTGCMHAREEVTYSTTPGGLGPTSTRPIVRVYPNPSTSTEDVGVAPTSMDDMDRAVAIRNMLQNNRSLRMAARNVDIEVKSGKAILRGSVRNQTESQLLEQRVAQSPGINSVENRLMIQ
ncbi:MAG TPA: BON domain-containing protein [Verrucomicrobiae bacterium]|nr:BON domain-containing protein [Verrucomicrobiae bacterium]